MNLKRTAKRRSRLENSLLAVVLALLASFVLKASAAVEETFPVLQTRTATYTNVTVTKKTQEWIFILHSTGMVNVKVGDLPLATQRALGYGMERPKESAGAMELKKLFSGANLPEVKKWAQNESAKISAVTFEKPAMFYGGLAIAAFGYVFSSFCAWKICRKTHIAPGVLAWVPVFQIIPLLRAANMSLGWFFAFFVPILNILAAVVWCGKIVQARGKSPWVALFLLLPVTSFFALLYLAFSSDAPVEVPRSTSESLVLETA